MMTPTPLAPTLQATPTPSLDFRDVANLHVHLLGVGGAGMSGLAAMFMRRGARVSGVDALTSAATERLMDGGARVALETEQPDLPAGVNVVVASAAIPDQHAHLLAARRRNVTILKYAQALGLLMQTRVGVAVSGTHGKSTTTAWTAFLLRAAGVDPNFIVGADVPQLGGGSGVGDGPHFVAEACEYDQSFLNLHPTHAAILNIEEDHLDYYANIDAIRAAFARFAALVPPDGTLLINGDDANCRLVAASAHARVESFGFGPGNLWYPRDVELVEGSYRFTIVHQDRALLNVHVALPGKHNVLNALATAALARACGADAEQLRAGLEGFRGAQRRMTLVGEVAGVRVVDDYGHHPTEISATLCALRERYQPRRLWCVFQPHQHSRTRFLLREFAGSFTHADRVIVPDIYFVRDTQRDRELVCAQDLVDRVRTTGRDAEYIPDFDRIVDHLARQVAAGDVVVTMGAGNIWNVADALVARLRADRTA